MTERLQKILSAYAVASRRAADAMLAAGRVSVNGKAVKPGDSADPDTDRILVDGKPLPKKDKPLYIMLHKPRGYVTTLSDERGRKTAASLITCGSRVYPVGRLDMASEGLLIFTNDGALANRLMHPRNETQKVYEVTVCGADAQTEELLRRPIVLDGSPIATPSVRLLRQGEEKTAYEVTIHEGRNHQVRRMCEAAGLRVLRLRRVKEGALSLGTLPVGRWRFLTEAEISLLKEETAHGR